MGKLVCIVGNSGVGKTALAKRLSQLASFDTGLEQHMERPFQKLFSMEHQRYALANQVDYLLLRAEQELVIRKSSMDGIIDGGLDLDFHIFSRLFLQKGYLSQADFEICQRIYYLLREFLPPPEVVVYLSAPLPEIMSRYAKRGRKLEIATIEDLEMMQILLQDWTSSINKSSLITVDASIEDEEFAKSGEEILQKIQALLGSRIPSL